MNLFFNGLYMRKSCHTYVCLVSIMFFNLLLVWQTRLFTNFNITNRYILNNLVYGWLDSWVVPEKLVKQGQSLGVCYKIQRYQSFMKYFVLILTWHFLSFIICRCYIVGGLKWNSWKLKVQVVVG